MKMKGRKRTIAAVIMAVAALSLTGCDTGGLTKTFGVEPAAPAATTPKPTPKPTPEPTETPMQPPSAADTAHYYSTDEKPSFGDFEWFTNQIQPILDNNAVPEVMSANAGISDRALAEGGWKAMIVWDPKGYRSSEATYYENAVINTSGDNVSLTLKSYLVMISGEETIYSTDPDERCAGTWNGDNTFMVQSAWARITMTSFYERDGKQYAIGTAETVDGIDGYIALVRP